MQPKMQQYSLSMHTWTFRSCVLMQPSKSITYIYLRLTDTCTSDFLQPDRNFRSLQSGGGHLFLHNIVSYKKRVLLMTCHNKLGIMNDIVGGLLSLKDDKVPHNLVFKLSLFLLFFQY